jgi:hypothetical protein
VENLKSVSLGQAPAFPTNTILSRKGFPGINTLAYYENSRTVTLKSLITLGPSYSIVALLLIEATAPQNCDTRS